MTLEATVWAEAPFAVSIAGTVVAPHEGGCVNEGGGNGWIWFILIFVVGNFILYATTGIFFIPIPRK